MLNVKFGSALAFFFAADAKKIKNQTILSSTMFIMAK